MATTAVCCRSFNAVVTCSSDSCSGIWAESSRWRAVPAFPAGSPALPPQGVVLPRIVARVAAFVHYGGFRRSEPKRCVIQRQKEFSHGPHTSKPRRCSCSHFTGCRRLRLYPVRMDGNCQVCVHCECSFKRGGKHGETLRFIT